MGLGSFLSNVMQILGQGLYTYNTVWLECCQLEWDAWQLVKDFHCWSILTIRGRRTYIPHGDFELNMFNMGYVVIKAILQTKNNLGIG
jgi:hypothetical protein